MKDDPWFDLVAETWHRWEKECWVGEDKCPMRDPEYIYALMWIIKEVAKEKGLELK